MSKWNPGNYQQLGSFVPTLGEPLIELLDPKPGMRILDVGCGNGTLTLKLMESGAQVVGIDASAAMVEAAKAQGIDAHVIDAHDLEFENEFDAAFSNAALHWMTQHPPTVVQNIYRALKPGGKFVGEMGGKGNIATIQRCLRNILAKYDLELGDIAPKFFPSDEDYRALLEATGFKVESIELFDRPTRLPKGIAEWVQVFAEPVMDAIPTNDHARFLEAVEECTRPTLHDDQGWWADYVRLRFVAMK